MGFLCIAKQTIPTLLPLKVYNNNSILVSIGSVLNAIVSILLEFGCVRNGALMRLCVMISVFSVSMFHAKCSYNLFLLCCLFCLMYFHGPCHHVCISGVFIDTYRYPAVYPAECLSFKTVGCRLTCKYVGVLTGFFVGLEEWAGYILTL